MSHRSSPVIAGCALTHVIHPHARCVTRRNARCDVAFGQLLSLVFSLTEVCRMNPSLRILVATATVALAGCATVSGTPTQAVSIHTVDAFDRPVTGMRCRIGNASADYVGDTPMFDLQVRRSASDLEIECRRGNEVARGTAVSRGTTLVTALLPGGTAAILIDHVSGYRYTYPQTLRLRVGEHLVFDPSTEPPQPMRVEVALDSSH
jgi:hypothetical protein